MEPLTETASANKCFILNLFINRLDKTFMFSFVSIFFVANSYYINRNFFAFTTKTEIRLNSKDTLKFPHLTVCFRYNMTDYGTLERYQPKLFKNKTKPPIEEIMDFIELMPVNELNRHGRLQYEFRIECEVSCSANTSYVSEKAGKECFQTPCSKFFPVQEKIYYNPNQKFYKCYTYMSPDSNDRTKYYEEENVLEETLYILTLYYLNNLDPKIQPEFHLNLDSGIALRALDEKFRIYALQIDSINIEFDIVSTLLLPYPYTTNCRTYDEFHGEGQRGCITECLKSEFNRR